MTDEILEWTSHGCPQKILELNACIDDKFMEFGGHSRLDRDLGSPVKRKPRTAIVNMVSYHEEIVATMAFHMVKLRHNVTVFRKDSELGIDPTVHHFLWKGFRRYERIYESFYEFDTVIFTTFPVCHLELLQGLVKLKLPQRYIVMVHNPATLNSAEIAEVLTASRAGVLTIAPHVLAATQRQAQTVGLNADMGWVAPIFPVVFPEFCVAGSWRLLLPACQRFGNNVQLLAEGMGAKTAPRAPPARAGICLQGKLDPTRRNYTAIFTEIMDHVEELKAQSFSLVLQGKSTGLPTGVILEIPQVLLDLGLVHVYDSLPFQEYYDVLHHCVAVLPAFASAAYYVDKGSSTIGTALIAGTPLIATRQLLDAYTFITEESVFLVDENLSYVEALRGVLALPLQVRQAKVAAVEKLRRTLLRTNLETLQDMLGPDVLYKGKTSSRDLAGEAVWGSPDSARWEEMLPGAVVEAAEQLAATRRTAALSTMQGAIKAMAVATQAVAAAKLATEAARQAAAVAGAPAADLDW